MYEKSARRSTAAPLRLLFEEGPLGYQSLDARGQILAVNDAWLNLLGYRREEVVGRSIRDFIAPEDHSLLAERFPCFLATGVVRSADYAMQHRDGSRVQVEVDGRIEQGPEGVVRTHCLLHDVTELHRSREQLQHLFENAPVSLWSEDFSALKTFLDELRDRGVTDADLHFRTHPDDLEKCATLIRVVDVNKSVLKLHKAGSKEEIIDSITDTFTERSFAGFRTEVVALFDGETTVTVESELRALDGEVRQVLARILVDPQVPDWSVVYVAVTDLTDALAAEQVQALLTTAVEQAAEIIMVTDTEGIIQYINPAFSQVTGYSRDEAVGRNVNFLQSGQMEDGYYEDLWDDLRAGRTWAGPMINRRRDGTVYEEEAAISPVRDGTGETVAYVAVKRDVTRERDLEKRLLQSQKLDAIGQLAGGIAHDFNNILQAMSAILELSEDTSEPVDVRLADLGLMRQSIERATALTRQLLAFSRGQVLDLTTASMDDLLRRLLDMMRRLIAEHIELDFRPGAPAGQVQVDAGQIEQVLVNLCVNARDAMPDGGVIGIETDVVSAGPAEQAAHPWVEAGQFVAVRVRDTGHGMDPKILNQIFEPFFTTKEPGRGTGLGLATVYGIVKQHKGFVTVASTAGEGSVFSIYLPLQAGPAPLPRTETDARPATGGNEEILLAEDDPMVQRSVKKVLERAGYHVVTASDGQEACELVEREPDRFALAILDMIMPRLGGREAANVIRVTAPDTSILFCSGYSEDALGGDLDHGGLLNKPYDREELLTRVRTVLDER